MMNSRLPFELFRTAAPFRFFTFLSAQGSMSLQVHILVRRFLWLEDVPRHYHRAHQGDQDEL